MTDFIRTKIAKKCAEMRKLPFAHKNPVMVAGFYRDADEIIALTQLEVPESAGVERGRVAMLDEAVAGSFEGGPVADFKLKPAARRKPAAKRKPAKKK